MAGKPKRKKLLNFFYDHEDQEAKDLEYGAQKEACESYVKKETKFEDHSIEGDWIPDED